MEEESIISTFNVNLKNSFLIKKLFNVFLFFKSLKVLRLPFFYEKNDSL